MLELCGITKRYGDKPALNQVSLHLGPGIYGLLGPNGAGKSTLMNIITGNCRPTEGQVKWAGMDIKILGADYRSLLGYAPQQQGLYDSFTGKRFLSYMASLKGIPGREQRAEIERVLDYVNLREAAGRAIGGYSGGMKQRILIAQAMLGNPRLIVLDEPTAGLDPKERVRIRERIASLSGDRIILVSTHVVSDIEPIADEIILIKAGHILDRGSVAGLCRKYGCGTEAPDEKFACMTGKPLGDPACMTGGLLGEPACMTGKPHGDPACTTGMPLGDPVCMTGKPLGDPACMTGVPLGDPACTTGMPLGDPACMTGVPLGDPACNAEEPGEKFACTAGEPGRKPDCMAGAPDGKPPCNPERSRCIGTVSKYYRSYISQSGLEEVYMRLFGEEEKDATSEI